MLSEEVRQLLAAYVDGAVSTRQRKLVERLLRKSAEARALLEQLQCDSGELRALKRQKLPQDFSLQVMKDIAEKKLQPAAPPPPPFPAWFGLSVAAAILLLVTGASFLFFSTFHHPPESAPVANKPLFRLPDLALDEAQTRELSTELAKGEAQRLKLTCQDPARAVVRLAAALKEHGIRLVVPSKAWAALNKDAKVRYLIYAEDVAPAELAAMLQQMGSDDRIARALGKGGAGFGPLLVHPIHKEDRQELSMLMGIDAKELQPGAMGQALDLKTAIRSAPGLKTDRSEDAAKNTLTKKGPERLALVLPLADGADVTSSSEVRAFLIRRGPVRPGTLQVIVEIQPAPVSRVHPARPPKPYKPPLRDSGLA